MECSRGTWFVEELFSTWQGCSDVSSARWLTRPLRLGRTGGGLNWPGLHADADVERTPGAWMHP